MHQDQDFLRVSALPKKKKKKKKKINYAFVRCFKDIHLHKNQLVLIFSWNNQTFKTAPTSLNSLSDVLLSTGRKIILFHGALALI